MSGCHVPSETLEERIEKLEEHKNRQIDENRKISRRVDELDNGIDQVKDELSNELSLLEARFRQIEKWINSWEPYPMPGGNRTPHKCPVCDGIGKNLALIAQQVTVCQPCEGKGIVWS